VKKRSPRGLNLSTRLEAARLRRQRRRSSAEAAVSDVVGSILLVAITTLMAVALGGLLFNLRGPTDLQHTDLQVTLDPGPDGKWQGEPGDSDFEQVRIMHLGGEPLLASHVTVTLQIGNTVTTATGTALAASTGAGSSFTTGKVWASNQSLARSDRVLVDIVTRLSNGGGQLISSSVMVAGSNAATAQCPSDKTPPYAVMPLSQTPEDVTSATTGNVTITAAVVDTCPGVDTLLPPQLWYCIAVTCSFPSGYTNGGSMTLVASLWIGGIPGGNWSSELGKTLHYRLVNMRDLLGNTANSSIQRLPRHWLDTYRCLGNRWIDCQFRCRTKCKRRRHRGRAERRCSFGRRRHHCLAGPVRGHLHQWEWVVRRLRCRWVG
jgi:FlaG/FlaF family flagellin (archaellin)